MFRSVWKILFKRNIYFIQIKNPVILPCNQAWKLITNSAVCLVPDGTKLQKLRNFEFVCSSYFHDWEMHVKKAAQHSLYLGRRPWIQWCFLPRIYGHKNAQYRPTGPWGNCFYQALHAACLYTVQRGSDDVKVCNPFGSAERYHFSSFSPWTASGRCTHASALKTVGLWVSCSGQVASRLVEIYFELKEKQTQCR